MIRSFIQSTVLVGVAMAAAVPAAHAQFGDLFKGVVEGEVERHACRLSGQQCNERGNTTQKSEVELAMMALEWTNRLNNAERPTSPTVSQSQLYSYSDNYAVQGSLTGAIVAAVVGCIIADYVLDASCSEGALIATPIGAVAGAVAGSRIKERQDIYRDREAAFNTKLSAARADLEDAKQARAAAEQVAQNHRANLQRLSADYQRTGQNRNELNRELGYATRDLEALTAARTGLTAQIQELEQSIASSQTTPEEQYEARRIIADLTIESQRMDMALQSLTGAVQSVRV